MTACIYCQPSTPDCLQYTDDRAYVCTRAAGHVGAHVACDDTCAHKIDTWEADQ